MYNNNTFLKGRVAERRLACTNWALCPSIHTVWLQTALSRSSHSDSLRIIGVLRSHVLNGIHYSLGLQNRQSAELRSLAGEKLHFKTKKRNSPANLLLLANWLINSNRWLTFLPTRIGAESANLGF